MTYPVPGATLTKAPAEIRLQFSEPVNTGSTLVLFTRDFQQIPLSVEIDFDQPTDLVAPTVPSLTTGIYTVQWLVINQDQHQISGSYQFQMVEDQEVSRMVNDSTNTFAWLAINLSLATFPMVWWWFKKSRQKGRH